MNRLIQDLLDVALVEAGQLRVDKKRLTTVDLVRDAVEAQAPLASSAGLELRSEVGRHIDDVWGDRDRLLQVFDNLIGNAIKFSRQGGNICVRAVPTNGEILFSVTDTGEGIGPDALAHVFDAFWQAATHAKRLGAGLGLPITRGIVEAHGGRIWAASTVGRGSTFSFSIPAAS